MFDIGRPKGVKTRLSFWLLGTWGGHESSGAPQHIHGSGVQVIQGNYRGKPVIHYLNPDTQINVIADPAGLYVSGWKLCVDQLDRLLTTGRLF